LPVLSAALGAAALILVVGGTAATGAANVGRWAAVAELLLALPLILAGLLLLAVALALIYVLIYLIRRIPRYSGKLQDAAHTARSLTVRASDMLVRPAIEIDALLTAARSLVGKR